jgi:hydrogenase maturation protease
MNSVLIAGIGNTFHGDDGFGVAVAQQLAQSEAPAGVDVIDFGIRGLDLAYALTSGYRLAVLVDTVQRGGQPGTLYLIEPELADMDAQSCALSPHQIDPASILQLTRGLGGECARIFLIGCEPASFGDEEEGHVGLSEPVAGAIAEAAAMSTALIVEWLAAHPLLESREQKELMQ